MRVVNEQIDILMAVYNGEKYLKEQLDSILNQTYEKFNLIISNDCSSDNSLEILNEYQKRDDRIVVFDQEKNLGLIKNFEFLLTKVINKYFMLSDQDDVWYNNKIEVSLNKIVEDNVMLVHTDLEVVDDNLRTINNSFLKQLNIYKKAIRFNDYNLIFLDNCVTGCTILANSEIIEKALCLPEKPILHDWWLALIAGTIGKIGFINEPTIKYRQHESNLIGANSKKQFENFKEYKSYRIKLYYEQFYLYNKYIDKFDEKIKCRIKEGYEYFTYIKNRKKIDIKKEILLIKVYKKENILRKIKAFILFH